MNPISLIMQFTGLGKLASTLALIVALFGLLAVGKCAYDGSIIDRYEDGVKADVIDATSEASEEADAEQAKYDAEFGKRQDKDRKDIEDAKRSQISPFDGMFD